MREILFRGKIKDNGEWVYGVPYADYIICGMTTAYYDDEVPMSKYTEFDHVEFIPETVGQYTGLTDKNGVKIFEGDILKGYQYPFLHDGSHNYYAEIIWFDNCPAFGTLTFKNPKSKVAGISTGNCELIEDWERENWGVIGNIHDNPELLEE